MAEEVVLPPSTGGVRSRRARRMQRRKKQAFALQLTSLMDVLIIIVIFLLKSYGISSMGIVQSDKLELPSSKAPDSFGEGMTLVISQERITVDNDVILKFQGDAKEKKFLLPEGAVDPANPEKGILPIYDALKKKKDDFDLLASRAPNPEDAAKKWTGDILVQADKSVKYDLVRQIMFTAGLAGYKQFRLTVEKQPE